MNTFFPASRKKQHSERGFTIIELIVSVSIMVVITSVALVSNANFNNSIFLTSFAYDVGIAIREAQTFGINVRSFRGGGGSTTDLAYGISFDRTTPQSFIFFADSNDDQRYSAIEERISMFDATRGNTVVRFCGVQSSGTQVCSDTGSNPLASLALTFKRPVPDARMRAVRQSGATVDFVRTHITLGAPDGARRCVTVESTGQITVGKTTCP